MATNDLSSFASAQPALIYINAEAAEHDFSEFGADSWYQREGWYLIDEQTGKPLIGPRISPRSCYN